METILVHNYRCEMEDSYEKIIFFYQYIENNDRNEYSVIKIIKMEQKSQI